MVHTFCHPEGGRKLAGGETTGSCPKMKCAPKVAREKDGFRRPLRGGFDAGCDPVVSPPADFHRPSGPFTMNARLHRQPRQTPRAPKCRGTPSSGQFPRPAFTRRFPCVRRGRRLSAAQNPPPVFPRKTSAGGFGLAQGIAFTEEHALFRFRQFLHRFDAFGDGAHGPKLWHMLAVSGKEMKKLGIRAQMLRCQSPPDPDKHAGWQSLKNRSSETDTPSANGMGLGLRHSLQPNDLSGRASNAKQMKSLVQTALFNTTPSAIKRVECARSGSISN